MFKRALAAYESGDNRFSTAPRGPGSIAPNVLASDGNSSLIVWFHHFRTSRARAKAKAKAVAKAGSNGRERGEPGWEKLGEERKTREKIM